MSSVPMKMAVLRRRVSGWPREHFAHPENLLDVARTEIDASSADHPPSRLSRTARITTQVMPGGRVLTVRDRKASHSPVLVYIHGGAYVFPFARDHWRILEKVHRATRATIIAPLYELAPVGTHADAVEFLRSVVGSELAAGHSWTLAGDSAGAGLALSLAMSLRDDPLPGVAQPSSLLLLSPWLDLSMADESRRERLVRDPVLARLGLLLAGTLFAGEASTSDASVSPLYGDPTGLPPVRIQQGTLDILASQSRAYRDKAARMGVDVELVEYPGALHGFVTVPCAREGRSAIRALEEAVRSQDEDSL